MKNIRRTVFAIGVLLVTSASALAGNACVSLDGKYQREYRTHDWENLGDLIFGVKRYESLEFSGNYLYFWKTRDDGKEDDLTGNGNETFTSTAQDYVYGWESKDNGPVYYRDLCTDTAFIQSIRYQEKDFSFTFIHSVFTKTADGLVETQYTTKDDVISGDPTEVDQFPATEFDPPN